MAKDDCPREKKWKHIYTRSNKLHRAKQLGFDYPRVSESILADRESLNILFVCSMNKWRSPTAETIFRNDPRFNARSAGTNNSARKKISEKNRNWADLICVMENKHKKTILSEYSHLNLVPIFVLDIPDDYQYMDQELISILKVGVEDILNQSR